ncbi:unnamed protein product [Cylicocyclus nassatus]|uniref:Uncharacterized protein n=1 Tax=Cylicocyclus nassatus TaxID=53992 RepID=A0AA36MD64_CYLNA|nr:unnamed protein product [Cylicocyclus nassatus]
MARFQGKVAIITGSSSGIGAVTAILFAIEGAEVTITGRKQHGLEATKKAILKAGVHNEKVNIVQADVTDSDGRELIISSTIRKFGRLDILVNNAGGTFLSPDGSAGLKASTDLLKKTMDVNVYSVVELIQLARPYLVSSKGEIYAKIPYYAMSKAALDQMMRAVAIELIAEGVRVNNVSPYGVKTNIAKNSGVSDEAAAKFYATYARNPFKVPRGRTAQPSEIATIIAFLADRSQSSYIVGQTIVADGGNSIVLASNADIPVKETTQF